MGRAAKVVCLLICRFGVLPNIYIFLIMLMFACFAEFRFRRYSFCELSYLADGPLLLMLFSVNPPPVPVCSAQHLRVPQN